MDHPIPQKRVPGAPAFPFAWSLVAEMLQFFATPHIAHSEESAPVAAALTFLTGPNFPVPLRTPIPAAAEAAGTGS
jgi:hypothetical protein